MDRNLDQLYFRAEQNGRWVNRCFSDLTPAEQERFASGWNRDGRFRALAHLTECWLRVCETATDDELTALVLEAAAGLKSIGDRLDVVNDD